VLDHEDELIADPFRQRNNRFPLPTKSDTPTMTGSTCRSLIFPPEAGFDDPRDTATRRTASRAAPSLRPSERGFKPHPWDGTGGGDVTTASGYQGEGRGAPPGPHRWTSCAQARPNALGFGAGSTRSIT
jgi:hypothetical protein